MQERDSHLVEKYKAFAEKYGITDLEKFVKLYDVFELVSFLPANPSEEDKRVLQELVGVEAPFGYMDYYRSGNTFELIMQWQEKTGNFVHQTPFQSDKLS